MLAFEYKAATSAGEVVNGVLAGTSRADVIEQLQALGHVPIRVQESAAKKDAKRRLQWRRDRITSDDVGDLTRELSTLLKAGLPLDRALGILTSLAGNDALSTMLGDVRERVKAGATLADAMEAQESVFSRFYISLLRAGESGGALEVVLERLADHMESRPSSSSSRWYRS
jgi:general secretion pathway protein F